MIETNTLEDFKLIETKSNFVGELLKWLDVLEDQKPAWRIPNRDRQLSTTEGGYIASIICLN